MGKTNRQMPSLAEPTQKRKSSVLNREAAQLERSVFGKDEEVLKPVEKTVEKTGKRRKPAPKIVKARKAVWIDDDCDAGKIKLSNYGTPDWAKLDEEKKMKYKGGEDDDDEDDDDLIGETHAGNLLDKSKSTTLPKRFLDMKRCKDINYNSEAEGKLLRAIEFHPSASVAVVAGMSGIASLFQIDGRNNPKIQSVVFKKFPIYTCHFSTTGEEFIVGSTDFGYFFYYDMFAGKIIRVPWTKDMNQRSMQDFIVSPDGKILAFYGKFGYIHLLTAKTKEWITSLKMNCNVRALAFNKNGSLLYSHGDNGEIYIWDMTTRDCIHKFYDDGCTGGTSLAISPNGQYLSAGSTSGVVNIYDASNLLGGNAPKPVKIIYNMTTAVTSMKFNHSSELLVVASNRKDNAIKFVHIPSMSVFFNFPDNQVNMKKPTCLDLSLNSGYFSVANNISTAFLYRLKQYENY